MSKVNHPGQDDPGLQILTQATQIETRLRGKALTERLRFAYQLGYEQAVEESYPELQVDTDN